jgi:hypothetical protein
VGVRFAVIAARPVASLNQAIPTLQKFWTPLTIVRKPKMKLKNRNGTGMPSVAHRHKNHPLFGIYGFKPKLFHGNKHPCQNNIDLCTVPMFDPYSSHMQINENEKESAKRLLRRLRIALIIWVVIFLITILWFMITS